MVMVVPTGVRLAHRSQARRSVAGMLVHLEDRTFLGIFLFLDEYFLNPRQLRMIVRCPCLDIPMKQDKQPISMEMQIHNARNQACMLAAAYIGLGEFVHDVIRHSLHHGGVDVQTLRQLRDQAELRVKDTSVQGLPIEDEGAVLNGALALFKHYLDPQEADR